MTKRNKFFYNGILLTAVGLAMRGAQLLFGAYISREVGAFGVGLNTLIMTVYSFAVTLATSGISLTVTRLTAQAIGEGKPSESGRILRGAASYALLFSTAATVGLAALSGVIGKNLLGDVNTVPSLQILALSLIPAAMSSVIGGYFIGIRKVSMNAAVQVLGQIFKVVFTVRLLSLLASRGTEYAVFALAASTTACELFCFLLALFEFLIHRRKAARASGCGFRAVAEMAFPLAISACVRSALLTLEHSLIPKRLQKRGESLSDALSSYGTLHGMALPVILFPMTPLTSFSGLLVPEFAECHGASDNTRLGKLASEAFNKTLVYAVCTSVFLSLFSEELGYVVYHSYDAGRYIAILAPVVPVMYLDHVTDSILKGVGEHIYSMWVNIADACLSVVLVYILIPLMGVEGYALVIVGMEVFNFTLSFIRLKRRVSFKMDFASSILIPTAASLLSVCLSKGLFVSLGSLTKASFLIAKLAFSVAAFLFFEILFELLLKGSRARRAERRALRQSPRQ